MRMHRNYRRRPVALVTSNAVVVEPLEPRLALDGTSISAIPAIPETPESQPVEIAEPGGLPGEMYILHGDGDAGPWWSQWIERIDAEAVVPVAVPAMKPVSNVPDLSWLDDGSGDGVSDADIYAFPAPQADSADSRPAETAASVAGYQPIAAVETPNMAWLDAVSTTRDGMSWAGDAGDDQPLSESLVLPSLLSPGE